jgi:hypothetical protein
MMPGSEKSWVMMPSSEEILVVITVVERAGS